MIAIRRNNFSRCIFNSQLLNRTFSFDVTSILDKKIASHAFNEFVTSMDNNNRNIVKLFLQIFILVMVYRIYLIYLFLIHQYQIHGRGMFLLTGLVFQFLYCFVMLSSYPTMSLIELKNLSKKSEFDPFRLVEGDISNLSGGIKELLGSDHPVLESCAK